MSTFCYLFKCHPVFIYLLSLKLVVSEHKVCSASSLKPSWSIKFICPLPFCFSPQCSLLPRYITFSLYSFPGLLLLLTIADRHRELISALAPIISCYAIRMQREWLCLLSVPRCHKSERCSSSMIAIAPDFRDANVMVFLCPSCLFCALKIACFIFAWHRPHWVCWCKHFKQSSGLLPNPALG